MHSILRVIIALIVSLTGAQQSQAQILTTVESPEAIVPLTSGASFCAPEQAAMRMERGIR